MVYAFPVIGDEPYDRGFRDVLIPGIRKSVLVKDNDYLLVFSGVTGSGKSSLGFHALHLFVEDPSIEYVALSRQRFAQSLKQASISRPPRYLDYDEADVIKRDAMSKWNKDIIKLYSKIRGKNIFHLWKHPSPEMLDKHQVEEVVNGLIWINHTGNPRRYYFFTKKALLNVIEKCGNLKPSNLTKAAKKHATWRGYFRKYDGSLWDEYLKLKSTSMDDAIDEFVDAWGQGKRYSATQAQRVLGCSRNTLYKYTHKLYEEGKLEGSKSASGVWSFTEDHIDMLRLEMMGESS